MPPPKPGSLETLAAALPRPTDALLGRRAGPLVLPDNIVCFPRRSARELNRPRRGRALHHRFVLILALRGAVPVCVDDRIVPLGAGEGLLVFPFQFHHYRPSPDRELLWVFVTFDLADAQDLAPLHYQPFALTPEVRELATRLLAAYRDEGRTSELPALLLALLLAHLRRQKHAPRRAAAMAETDPGLVMRVNQLAHRVERPVSIKELAQSLGISRSHLRARFRASCEVSLGRHLRRLRLERACGLLRLTPDRVTEVAAKCGFTSIYTFSRAFRAAYGKSPMEYRQGANVPRSRS